MIKLIEILCNLYIQIYFIIKVKFMNILVLFTYGISLRTWKEQGLIEREFKLYKKLLALNPNLKFTFITFGDNEDLEIQKQYDLECFEIIPIYSEIKLSRNKISNLIRTILFIFKYSF